MTAHPSSLSPELLQTNQRLYELRQQIQSHKAELGQMESQRTSLDVPPWEDDEPTPAALTTADTVSMLPSHLGWDSTAVTAAIRTAVQRRESNTHTDNDKPLRADHPASCPMTDRSYPGGQPLAVYAPDTGRKGTQLRLPLDGDTIRHYPSLGIAALQAETARAYRLWLLCRYLDVNGQGWLPLADVRQQVNGKDAKLRLCGWRRRFWTFSRPLNMTLSEMRALRASRLMGRVIIHILVSGSSLRA